MKKNDTLLKLALTYSAVLLLATIIGISVLIYKKAPRERTIIETVVQTEHIYVWVGGDMSTSDIAQTTVDEYIRILKEYEGKIGIFNEAGSLVDMIDVYVKTLPETDRRLLKEGIILFSEDELRSLIEDYSS